MSSFCAINLPQSNALSRAKNMPPTTFSPMFTQSDSILSKRPAEIFDCVALPIAKGSRLQRSKSRKRHNSRHLAEGASPTHMLSPPVDGNSVARARDRSSLESIEFPDLETLFSAQPSLEKATREQPHRKTKLLSSVETLPLAYAHIVHPPPGSVMTTGSPATKSLPLLPTMLPATEVLSEEETGLQLIKSTLSQMREMEVRLHMILLDNRKEREREAEEVKRRADERRERKVLRRSRKAEKRRRSEAQLGNEPVGDHCAGNNTPTSDRNTLGTETPKTQPSMLGPARKSTEANRGNSASPVNGQAQVSSQHPTVSPSSNKKAAQASDTATATKVMGGETGATRRPQNSKVERPRPPTAGWHNAPRRTTTLSPAQRPSLPTAPLSAAYCRRDQHRWGNGASSSGTAVPKGPKHPASRPWANSQYRREVELPNRSPACECSSLHSYFRKAWRFEPKLSTFPGCKAEFLAHVDQVANCPAHYAETREACRQILAKENESSLVIIRITS